MCNVSGKNIDNFEHNFPEWYSVISYSLVLFGSFSSRTVNGKQITAWKKSIFGVISGPYFLFFVFSLDTEKYGSEITPYLDTFYAVKVMLDAKSF